MNLRPMNADVLMVGIAPDYFDHFQRSIKGQLQSMHMGWGYVANHKESFLEAFEFAKRRPELDVIYIANQVNRDEAEMRRGVTLLGEGAHLHPAGPWIVLEDNRLEYLCPILESAGVTHLVERPLELVLTERYRRLVAAAA